METRFFFSSELKSRLKNVAESSQHPQEKNRLGVHSTTKAHARERVLFIQNLHSVVGLADRFPFDFQLFHTAEFILKASNVMCFQS